MTIRPLLISLCLPVCTATLSPGAVLADYKFPGGAATSADTDPDSTASSFGLTASGSSISASSENLFLRSSSTTSTTVGEAVTNNTYVSFTVTPGSGV